MQVPMQNIISGTGIWFKVSKDGMVNICNMSVDRESLLEVLRREYPNSVSEYNGDIIVDALVHVTLEWNVTHAH